MKIKDFRNGIIPRALKNNDCDNKVKKEYTTTDLVYLDSYKEQFGGSLTDMDRRASPTDHAKIHNVYISNSRQTKTGSNSCWWWLRSDGNRCTAYYVNNDGDWDNIFSSYMFLGLRPALLYNLPSNISARSVFRIFKRQKVEDKGDNLEYDIKEISDKNGEVIYHCLQLGERPKTKIDEELSKKLESLYHGGRLGEGIRATGRWYTDNGQKENYKDFAGVHSPEFEYEGEKYTREIAYPDLESSSRTFSDGTKIGEAGIVRWFKVEPVSWIIRNWDEMPKSINPKGNGKAKWFDLISEEVLTGNIPFYPNEGNLNCTMWQNSTIRGFFNGIDVRNITQNGSKNHGAQRGGNYTGECNFLNETFNLERAPIVDYAIPESETEIVDDAFNGCVTLNKLIIHSGVTKIGKRAFEGLDFKYAYRIKDTVELVFAKELPINKEIIQDIIELGKSSKNLVGFDYSYVLQNEKLDELYNLVETLNKTKFSIPFVYGKALIENGLVQDFCSNSDFRFFKGEFKNINNLLLDFPEEERLDFFKFAKVLGCFSKQKMLDKNGKETRKLLRTKGNISS